MKLDKKLVGEVIRLTKKYYRTGDVDYLPKLREVSNEIEKKAPWRVVKLIGDLAKYTQRSGKGTYDDIYKALAIFGIEVKNEIS